MSFGPVAGLTGMETITPCLWFDTEGEDAANFYTSIFEDSRITEVGRYPEGSPRAGDVMVVSFEINGQKFVALNGGPEFHHTEAISFQVPCASQEEVDHYWEKLGDGGEEGPCGWLKDRFGVSWQVFPKRLIELLGDPDPEVAQRSTSAMMAMKKIDLAAIEEAAATPA
jgi:predicted 3-demethylubiquinone-9 3-methyltransferase (glyoxalase superfamily)